MKKLTILTILISAIWGIGCSDITAPVISDENKDAKHIDELDGPGAITYDIFLLDSQYDELENLSTFEYSVTSNPGGGPAISHWMLEFAEDCGGELIVSSASEEWEWSDPDPTTDVSGVKFDTGYEDEETRTVTLVLIGEWAIGDIVIAVKSGNGFVLGEVQGPVCGNLNNENENVDDSYNIDGFVFYDLNENGIQDPDEPGIEGVEVTLSNGEVVFTDMNGYYEFTDLSPDVYTVVVGEHNGRDHTTPQSVDLTITDSDVSVDFGFTAYYIGETVYFDVNNNGVQDPDEPGIPGVEVTLSDGSVTTTDENGYFEFGALLPGDYSVSVETPAAFLPTTDTSFDVSIIDNDASLYFGFAIDFSEICGAVADGYTIGFWKNNLSKAISGKTRGVQVSAATLEGYVDNLSDFALSPLNFSTMSDAYDVLSARGNDAVLLLSKQLAGSEFNYQNSAYIAGNELLTWAFVYWGEFIIVHSGDYSRDQILEAKDWFDAYNNSHGGAIEGPDCQ